MKRNFFHVILALSLLTLTGCETFKVILGTSTRHLERARAEAITRGYDCTFRECFDAVLSLSRNEVMADPKIGERPFEVFIKDRVKGYIVVMGIAGNIETTEVGIFLTEVTGGTKIELSSLSSSAKEKAAEALFRELSLRFNQI